MYDSSHWLYEELSPGNLQGQLTNSDGDSLDYYYIRSAVFEGTVYTLTIESPNYESESITIENNSGNWKWNDTIIGTTVYAMSGHFVEGDFWTNNSALQSVDLSSLSAAPSNLTVNMAVKIFTTSDFASFNLVYLPVTFNKK